MVPYEVAGSPTATVELDIGGIHSAAWGIPVAPSAPGLFSQSWLGQGRATIFNQDNSLNTPSNPADPNSVVQILLTGEGQTNPPGITGEITQSDTKTALLDVSAQVGGVGATVVSATTDSNAIAGLFQIQARIPPNTPSGSVPIVVKIGSASSQGTATVSVR